MEIFVVKTFSGKEGNIGRRESGGRSIDIISLNSRMVVWRSWGQNRKPRENLNQSFERRNQSCVSAVKLKKSGYFTLSIVVVTKHKPELSLFKCSFRITACPESTCFQKWTGWGGCRRTVMTPLNSAPTASHRPRAPSRSTLECKSCMMVDFHWQTDKVDSLIDLNEQLLKRNQQFTTELVSKHYIKCNVCVSFVLLKDKRQRLGVIVTQFLSMHAACVVSNVKYFTPVNGT